MLKPTWEIDDETRALMKQYGAKVQGRGTIEWLTTPVVWARGWLDLLLGEKRQWQQLPWRKRLEAWRNGFQSHSWILYNLDHNDPSNYLPDIASQRFKHRPNGPYNLSLFSKIVFSRMLKSLDAPQPEVLGVLFRGRFYPEDSASSDAPAGIEALLLAGRKLVLRPSYGGSGIGIFFLEMESDQVRINRIPADSATLGKLVSGLEDYIVTAFVEQAAYARDIFPDTTNTLRILTLWDFEKEEPFVAATCHRFGGSASGLLDNFHSGRGGFSAPIELETGLIGPASSRDETGIVRLDHHPDTGQPIAGVIVPGWHATVRELLDLAARLPYYRCVGWDLVQTEQGWVCLEGNTTPGYWVWQVNGPLLTDPRTRRFYREFGFIR